MSSHPAHRSWIERVNFENHSRQPLIAIAACRLARGLPSSTLARREGIAGQAKIQ
jgi:hypothetical protein